MTTLTQTEFILPKAEPKPGTRIAAYLLTEYLERIGVEVIFGLCGHTIIAFLDALGRAGSGSSRRGTNRLRRTPPTATRACPARSACS